MEHMEKARQLRARTDVHYNCAQSLLVTFAGEMGLTEKQAYDLGSHFGSGMRHGSTCGALTSALMAGMRERRGALDCATLLKHSKEQGIPNKEHCDGLLY